MSDVQLFERATSSFAASLARRGHHIVYRTNAENHCPGCGRSQWYIGRISAECGFCGTAVPLAEARHDDVGPSGGTATSRARIAASTTDQRRHARMPAKGRRLQLLIDGSPSSFALHNISEGGAMGDGTSNLSPGTNVCVRFEGGILVSAVVKWTENGLVGLSFDAPIMLDRSAQPPN
ncbi:MAG TPA: PilZ domain-containing protein [Sphingomicrobium sp.]|nr:PilZ domain-containing protein [Sphingomicrobium sp.]